MYVFAVLNLDPKYIPRGVSLEMVYNIHVSIHRNIFIVVSDRVYYNSS